MNTRYPPIFVTLSPEAAIEAIAEAHEVVVGGEPSGATLRIISAHSAIETARWKRFPNFNYAGIRASSSWKGEWTSFTTREVINGKEEIWQPSDKNRFRAYASLRDGADDYLKFVVERYPLAWSAAQRGDDTDFVHQLKARGYFTAGEASYLSAEKGQEYYLQNVSIVQAYLKTVSARLA